MDDAHAHPLSPVNTIHTRSRSTTVLILRDQPPSSAHATPKSVPHTRQQRILQTRNARFPAQRLSVNSMTVPFPHLIRSAENDTSYFSVPRMTKREENGIDLERASDLISTSPRSSILNEITNSGAYRIRGIQRRAPIPVFQDAPDKRVGITAGSNTPSVYHDASSDVPSPSVTDPCRASPAAMGLREVSINLHRPSPSRESPYYRSTRSGSRRISSHSKPRFNSEEYIEHIENELQLVKDAMYSPTTNVPWKEKLRKAKEENDRLRKDMEALKSSFELELQQTVERSTEIELRLKRRIKDLEDEVEHKQTVILDLEYDRQEKQLEQSTLEVLRAKTEKLEEEKSSLEITNRDMMKRNEVLTQLLVLSPTKMHHQFELPTPRRRSARPMSMIIPRLPSSPGAHTPLSRPQSVLISPALPASDYFPASVTSSPLGSSSSCIVNNHGLAPDDVQSIDSGTGESSSQLTDGTSSRRSTLASCASNSPPIGPISHSQPEVRPQMPARQPSKRRPRKFMPGSTQLKPLLLPTFTAENGNLPSTSPIASPKRPTSVMFDCGLPYMPQWESPPAPQRRMESVVEVQPFELSHTTPDSVAHAFQSLDEVFTADRGLYCREVLKEPSDGRPDQSQCAQLDTSTQPSHMEAATEVHDDEDAHPRLGSWGLGIQDAMPADIDDRHDEQIGHNCHNDDASGSHTLQMLSEFDQTPSKCERVFQALEEHVEIPRPLFSKDFTLGLVAPQSPGCSTDDLPPSNPRKRRKASSASDQSTQGKEVISCDVVALDPVTRPMLTPSSTIKQKVEAASSRPRQSPSWRRGVKKGRNPLEMLQQRNVGARPLAALTIQTVYATLSRYTSYIQTFKRDPLALARRVIANAWRSNWATFGKLSWWVLGLFIGHRRPRPQQRAWDWDRYDGESIADRYCSLQRDRNSSTEAGNSNAKEPSSPATERGGSETKHDTALPDAPVQPNQAPKPGWGTSLFLWGKFSVAIMLAVGGAIVKGPGEMLRETEERRRSRSSSLSTDQVDEQQRGLPQRGGRFGESERIVRPDSRQQREDIGAPRTTRKARSFSSPTPPARTHEARPLSPDRSLASREPEGEGSDTVFHKHFTGPDHHDSSSNETIKPMRPDRKGLGCLFELPPAENQSRNTGDLPADINVPPDHGDNASIQHLLENG
ncbi:hypothetical protein A1O1_06166 [Capronia coronata CBS 617.96]|uniref:Uncharacterized protein n=1 Tax=Capronia coronata CBS 617.96 TaxID=1182541 RepID=W9XZZ0_9EURO|nr:uncharacterized protein A1O1_06166 [Capronia coronata CBS 617.96]EXJ85798.1 hypothetical protein A1O1_06166 [Capronia coronata CBS 617.96]